MDASTLKPERPFSSRVQAALLNGELWRAKDILQGAIGASEYDPLLFEQYGLVLLQMGDLIEAGKYLFLSGQAREEYQEAIVLYLKRFGHHNWQTLVSSFPRRVRNIKTELLPDLVQRELRRLEIPANRVHQSSKRSAVPRGKFHDKLALIGCGCIASIVFMCVMAGCMILIQSVTGWIK